MAVTARAYDGSFGASYWRRVMPQFVKVDFNNFYGRTAEASAKPMEWLCAYAFTQLDVAAAQTAKLELAAGHQPLQAWLNGAPVMPKATLVGSAPQAWPVELRAGANQLLVKVCKTSGDWSFTARITDMNGHDLPGVGVRAALPETALTAQPEVPTQLIDGFGGPVSASRQSALYSDYRGDSPAWWEALEDPNGSVVWKTDPVPARAPTVFAFTATMSEQPGEAELWVNRQYALTFPTGRFPTPQRWQRGPYVLEFVPRDQSGFLSGYARLLVPAEDITPGQPVELRVAHVAGSPSAYFQIKGRDDTVEVEHVSLDGLVPRPDEAATAPDAHPPTGAGAETHSRPAPSGAPPA
jgi:hypothetical protein